MSRSFATPTVVFVTRLLASVMLLCLVATRAQAQCSVPCTLVWSDEFSGTSLDLSKWEYQYGDGSAYGIPGWGNNEKQIYTDTHALVSGGVLTIEAVEVNAWDGSADLGDWESSRIRTRNQGDWAFGRFEARIQLPQNQGLTTGGQGTWPAFWLLPYNSPYGGRGWPFHGEIDIMEWLGHNPTNLFGTIHYPVAPGNPASTNDGGNTTLPSPLAWHTYAVEWEPGEIRWYLDGSATPFLTKNSWSSGAIPFDAPFDVPNFHIILNLAIGGNFPGDPNATSVFPQEFKIDWVRVYDMGDTQTPVIPPVTDPVLVDDFEHNDVPSQWSFFVDGAAGGGISNIASVPPSNGGGNAMDVGFGGNQGAFWGGFSHSQSMDLSGMETLSFWINPNGAANEDFNLEINIQDDDSGEGSWTQPLDEEYQYVCRISATGPCAIVGGGWQQVTIPISDFLFDNSFSGFIDGVLNTEAGGNGLAESLTLVVVDLPGGANQANFELDYFIFEGPDVPTVVAIPTMLHWMYAVLALVLAAMGWCARRYGASQ